MSECRHEWEAWGQIGSSGIAYIRCKAEGCNERLTTVEVEAILNEHAALKRENKRLLDGIRNARHCLTHGRNTTPTEGEEFDIGTTYTKLSMMLGEPWSTLLTAEEPE